jgi:hypothetical protein
VRADERMTVPCTHRDARRAGNTFVRQFDPAYVMRARLWPLIPRELVMQNLPSNPTSTGAKREVPLRYPPSEVPLVTQVRSTLISSSVHAIADQPLMERYKERLPTR